MVTYEKLRYYKRYKFLYYASPRDENSRRQMIMLCRRGGHIRGLFSLFSRMTST